MSAQTTQIQLKLSLSERLNDLLESKAARLGVPVTQFVKHLIVREVEDEDYPVFKASKRLERITKKALADYDNVPKFNNIQDFFKSLK
jgi:hypothetical protein